MKPFVILCLPRGGTTMLVTALRQHPSLQSLGFEFNGDEAGFWENPHVMTHYWRDWMADDRIVKILYYRADLFAGAMSHLRFHMPIFPDGVCDLPISEVKKLMEKRARWYAEFNEKCDHRFSYEEITGGNNLVGAFPEEVSRKLCEWLGIHPSEFVPTTEKSAVKFNFRNQEELTCLRESSAFLTLP